MNGLISFSIQLQTQDSNKKIKKQTFTTNITMLKQNRTNSEQQKPKQTKSVTNRCAEGSNQVPSLLLFEEFDFKKLRNKVFQTWNK